VSTSGAIKLPACLHCNRHHEALAAHPAHLRDDLDLRACNTKRIGR